LSVCNRDELQGVIAHEMAHVRNRDILMMIMVGVLLGTIVLLADLFRRSMFYGGMGRHTRRSSRDSGQAQAILAVIAIVLAILAPILAQLIYFAVSRKREYLADACGAQFTRYPEGLASALEKIAASPATLQRASRATAPMYIINPLKSEGRAANDVTSTHPPIHQRIRILRGMGGGAAFVDYERAYRQITGRRSVLPASALKESSPLPARPADQGDEKAADRVRQATDVLWKLSNFSFINCACGVVLKIPPSFRQRAFQCPHCGRQHDVIRR
jgi:heat shock protein HtpX